MQDIIVFLQTHWQLSLALGFILLLLIMVEFIRAKKGAKSLSPAQVVDVINRQNGIVVDIRPEDTFKAGHVVNAISLPLKDLEAKLKKIEKYKSQPIVLVCGTGSESPRAAALLSQKGYQVFLLGGGLRAWRDASMPVVKG